MKFKTYKIKDLINEISMGPFGSNIKVECFVDSGIPVLNGSNLTGFALNDNSFRYVTPEKADSLGKANAYRGDIVITHRGTLGQIVFIPKNSKHSRYVISQSQFRVKCNEKILPEYLVYYFHTNAGQHKLLSNASQVGVPALARASTTFQTLEIDIPDVTEQRKIVDLLETIREKIELNNAINNNLEQKAQALYENIFCISSDIDTKHISLSDLMDYAGGSQPPASEFVFSERNGYIRFVQIRDYDTDSHITYIPDSPKNKLCEEHDIMIARYGASLGRICFGINGAYNVALAKVFPKKSFFREFLRCYLSSRTFYEGINNKGGRSAQAGFNQSDINSFEIDFPVDETIVKKFESTVAPMFEQRLQLKKENQHLASLRDTLLPKLMSGELDVSNVEI